MFLNTLPDHARVLLKKLGQEQILSAFYLAGGSAVALHLGHRISVDLDFFSPQPSYQAEPLLQKLQTIGRLDIFQKSEGTLLGSLDGVRLSFFVYPYPLLENLLEIDGVKISALMDLALMKIIAVSQRGTKRDFVDLHFICKTQINLEALLKKIPEKYQKVSYPSYHLLRALTFFADAERDEDPKMLASWNWPDTKEFFEAQVAALFKNQ